MQKGYRAICWFYVSTSKENWRKDFVDILVSSAGLKESYAGVCFGKYSRVVDFFDPSAKVASYKISCLVENLTKSQIRVSPSLILCKPLSQNYLEDNKEWKIRAYTFYRPQSSRELFDVFSSKFVEKSSHSSVYSECFWNNSGYPFMKITYGNSYEHVINQVQESRMEADWAIDSSTIVSLRVNFESKEPVKDDKVKSIPVIVFVKARRFAKIKEIELRKPGTKIMEWRNSLERFGWYDLCDGFSFDSLHDLYSHILITKKFTDSNIAGSATLLLKELT